MAPPKKIICHVRPLVCQPVHLSVHLFVGLSVRQSVQHAFLFACTQLYKSLCRILRVWEFSRVFKILRVWEFSRVFKSLRVFGSFWEFLSVYERFLEFLKVFENFHIFFNKSTRLMAMALFRFNCLRQASSTLRRQMEKILDFISRAAFIDIIGKILSH